MEKKNTQPAVDVDGVVVPFRPKGSSGGYKSGRSSDRETPETRSIWSTRSAGTMPPRISQLATTPCDLRPSARASAVCPPTASHASINALLVMPNVTTQGGYYVNTVCDDRPAQNSSRMSRRPRAPASAFWSRLEEAIGKQYSDFNTNSLAKDLGLRQSAVYRWYDGTALPELHRVADFARKGGVCVEWLINGTKPKHPISKDPTLRELFELCEQIDPTGDGRAQVLRMARNELLAQTELERQEAERQKRRSS